MAMPYQEITKSEFNKNYNVVKILRSKQEIMEYVKTQYQESKDNVVAFAIRKRNTVTLNDVVNTVNKITVTLEYILDQIKTIKDEIKTIKDEIKTVKDEIKTIKDEIKTINTRLDIIEDKLERNNIK